MQQREAQFAHIGRPEDCRTVHPAHLKVESEKRLRSRQPSFHLKWFVISGAVGDSPDQSSIGTDRKLIFSAIVRRGK
jgi:hypothetical protein